MNRVDCGVVADFRLFRGGILGGLGMIANGVLFMYVYEVVEWTASGIVF